ncbi:hypothetical protein T08_998 [Trichinella sp. T8]|nr:hypothetical protein T08_998 [Trichinella sp. T8]
MRNSTVRLSVANDLLCPLSMLLIITRNINKRLMANRIGYLHKQLVVQFLTSFSLTRKHAPLARHVVFKILA